MSYNMKKIASRVVNGMEIKKGENVWISTGIHSQELAEEIALQMRERGSLTLITSTSDNYTKGIYHRVPV